jgi:hypothetical protein
MQHRPPLIATRGPAPMVGRPLSQRAVATCDGRGGPLQRLGLLSRPPLPPLQHLGGALRGDRGAVKRVLNGLPGFAALGFAARATPVRHGQVPIPTRPQDVCTPVPPPRRQDPLRAIVLHPLPPQVEARGPPRELRAPLGQGGRCAGQALRFASRCERVALSVHLALALWCTLACRVDETPRMYDQRSTLQVAPIGETHARPARDRGAPRLPPGLRVGPRRGPGRGDQTRTAGLLSVIPGPPRLGQTTAQGQRRARDQGMDAGKHLRQPQAVHTRCGQLHEGLGSGTDQGPPPSHARPQAGPRRAGPRSPRGAQRRPLPPPGSRSPGPGPSPSSAPKTLPLPPR